MRIRKASVCPVLFWQKNGWHYCQLWNPTDEPMVLGAGKFIGQLTLLADIVSIAQENAPAAEKMDAPCYVTGNQGQGDYPRPNNYRNKHRRYSADQVRASPTNFSPGRNNGRTQNSYSRSNIFAQNDRGTNIENHEQMSELRCVGINSRRLRGKFGAYR